MIKRVEFPLIAAVAAAVFLTTVSCNAPVKSREAMIEEVLAGKRDVTILVTDSGLGGLSVAADLAARLPQSGVFRRARIVFYNALFHDTGYNGLGSEAEKVRIFDQVLRAMHQKYEPDILLIACNTLSVLYDLTPFSRWAPFPAVGIVETGVDLIARQFAETPDATAIIFGTKTTIGSEAHKKALVARGIPPGQIIGQACHKLAGAIERGTETEETTAYIKQFVTEALAKAGGPASGRTFFGSFNCTHYGYARKQFSEAFAAAGIPDIVLLDPNPHLADFMFRPEYLHKHPETSVTVETVSKLEITAEEIASIGPLLRTVSPAAADSLENYELKPDLFEVDFKAPPKK